MSEQPVLVREHYRGGGPSDGGPGAAPPPGDGPVPSEGGGGGGMSTRLGPLPLWGWLALGGVLAVGAWFWIRRGQSGAAAASQNANSASTAGTATDTGCYDAAGNSTPCAQADYASEIASLQDEIDNMQGGNSTPVATPGAGSTMSISVPDVIGDSAIQARAMLQAAGLSSTVQGSVRGQVTAQSPTAGTVVSVGSSVTLTTTGGTATARALPRQQTLTTPS